jgi:hypothetical protein
VFRCDVIATQGDVVATVARPQRDVGATAAFHSDFDIVVFIRT